MKCSEFLSFPGVFAKIGLRIGHAPFQRTLFAGTLSLLALLPAISQTPPVFVESELVHYGDLIDIDVAGGFEFDWRGSLTPEGFLNGLNSFGDPIYGLCRKESDIALDVTKAYSKFLRDPQVTVRVIDRSSRAVVTLDGAIRFPQRFQLRRGARLRELLVLSGGITEDSGGSIQIFRPRHLSCELPKSKNVNETPREISATSDVDPQITVISISDVLSGKESADPAIRSGDLISVQRSMPIYMIGGVNNPRQISARPGLTLLRAIATSGGLSKDADGNKVFIYRRNGDESRIVESNIAKIEAGTELDPELRPFDIVEIETKGRGKRKYPPVIANVATNDPLSLPLRIIE